MKQLYTKGSRIQGTGLYTSENIEAGEFIAFIQGKKIRMESIDITTARDMELLFGLTKTTWIDPKDTIWSYFNHSCEPNTAIIGRKKVIALSKINKDEELTFDYSMTDGDLNWEMPCTCNSSKCRKVITSIQKIDSATFNNHMPFIPRYFQNLRIKYLGHANIKK